MKRSLSGETVHVLSFLTLKRGSPLVARQGVAMQRIGAVLSNSVPDIYWVGSTWYLMQTIKETLAPVGYLDWNWRSVQRAMASYWIMPERWIYPDVGFRPKLLFEYIEEQGWSSMTSIPSLSYFILNYNGMPRLTHGDLTHENTIIQPNGVYKFIDWQAQRHPYIPAHKDVDYGKLLQSLLGWDEESSRALDPKRSRDVRDLLRVAPMAWFWCAIHFMRIKKRAHEQWLIDICDVNIDYCFYLGEEVDA